MATDDETTERTGLLSGSGAHRRKGASGSKKPQNYKSFRFAEVYDPNPRFYITKSHAIITVLILVGCIAWITTSLVIGLPALEKKMELYKQLHPGKNVDT
ncbi:hypothetical protein HDE_01697 [Halotydeus destructor]|nr:hypothetical protein HDE_01697 [Halotydeus destructor]